MPVSGECEWEREGDRNHTGWWKSMCMTEWGGTCWVHLGPCSYFDGSKTNQNSHLRDHAIRCCFHEDRWARCDATTKVFGYVRKQSGSRAEHKYDWWINRTARPDGGPGVTYGCVLCRNNWLHLCKSSRIWYNTLLLGATCICMTALRSLKLLQTTCSSMTASRTRSPPDRLSTYKSANYNGT